MTALFLVLMTAAGAYISFCLVSDSRKRTEYSKRLYHSAALIEERVRYTRDGVEEALDADSDALSLGELLSSSDIEVSKLTDKICSSDYEAALRYSELLKIHTEKEMQRSAERERTSFPIKVYLPPAACVLAAILLM